MELPYVIVEVFSLLMVTHNTVMILKLYSILGALIYCNDASFLYEKKIYMMRESDKTD